jgi:hypothetical protein
LYVFKVFDVLVLLLLLGCIWFGSALEGKRTREAQVLALLLAALLFEVINIGIGAHVNATNAALRHAGQTHLMSRPSPLQAHLAAAALVVWAVLFALAPRLRTVRLRRSKSVETVNE